MTELPANNKPIRTAPTEDGKQAWLCRAAATETTTPNHRRDSEALLASRADSQRTARKFELADHRKENREGSNPEPRNRQWQGPEVPHASMAEPFA